MGDHDPSSATGADVLWKAARSVVMVAFGWALVTALPPLARWLRMREM